MWDAWVGTSLGGEPTILSVSYEKWPWPEHAGLFESDAYVLYVGGVPAVALSNQLNDRSFLLVGEARKSDHFFRLSSSIELLRFLLEHHVTVQTGLPGYNPLSAAARKVIERVNDKAEHWGLIVTPLEYGHHHWEMAAPS